MSRKKYLTKNLQKGRSKRHCTILFIRLMMKPKTKLQHQIVALSNQLPKITESQKLYAFKNCLEHKATRLKNRSVTCMDCGHSWKDEHQLLTTIDCNCLKCDTKLEVIDTRKKLFSNWAYYGVITTLQGFQVIRLYKVEGRYKVGEKAQLSCYEVCQIWMLPNGKFEIVGRIHVNNGYQDSWTGYFELRNKKNINAYNLNPYKIFPYKKIIPELARNGFKGSFYNLSPLSLFNALLTNSKAETLIKSGQTQMLGYCDANRTEIYWGSIKICIRNKYIIRDVTMWFDYLELLSYFKKDLRSPKYVCPPYLKKAHDKFVEKKKNIQKREKLEKLRKDIQEAQIIYTKEKQNFFGLQFKENDLSIKVIETVEEFMQEGDTHKHCVFVNEYYKKSDSLVLSAKINDEPIETIEVSLSEMKIIQSRGKGNEASKHNSQILNLVNHNLHKISSIINQKNHINHGNYI